MCVCVANWRSRGKSIARGGIEGRRPTWFINYDRKRSCGSFLLILCPFRPCVLRHNSHGTLVTGCHALLSPDGTALSSTSRRKGLILDKSEFFNFFRHRMISYSFRCRSFPFTFHNLIAIDNYEEYHTFERSTIAFQVSEVQALFLEFNFAFVELEIFCFKFFQFYDENTLENSKKWFDHYFTSDEGGLFFERSLLVTH